MSGKSNRLNTASDPDGRGMAKTLYRTLQGILQGTFQGIFQGTRYARTSCGVGNSSTAGMTLIELMIVLTVVAILMAIAVPSYTRHSLRVHRSEAIQLLLQAAICQEHILARTGSYDTSQCMPASTQQRYDFSYAAGNSRSLGYTAIATPLGSQLKDACGSMLLDHSGSRRVAATGVSASKCWSGR